MKRIGRVSVLLVIWSLAAVSAAAQDTVEERLRRLEAVVEEQARQMSEQKQALAAQQQVSAELKQQLQQKDQEIRGLKTANAPLGRGPVGSLVERPVSAPGSDKQSMYASWRDGLNLCTEDQKIRLKIGGRIVNDWSSLNEDERISKASGKQEYTTMMRSARISFAGEMPNHIIFAADYEFADDFLEMDLRNTLRSAYVGLTDLPYIGTWRVGRFNEPFSLEDLTDPLFQTFTEPGLPEALLPGARGVISRSMGTMLNSTALDDRMTWAVGYFRDALRFAARHGDDVPHGYSNTATDRQMTDTFRPGGRANWGVTGRVTGLPWYKDDGAKLLHLGAAYSFRSNWDRRTHIFSRPEVRAGSLFTYAEIDSGGTDHLDAELALVYDRFSLQAQYIAARVRSDTSHLQERTASHVFEPDFDYYVFGKQILHSLPPLGHEDAFFQSFYVYGSVFLTGEHRNYLKRYGAFGRVHPNHDFLDGQGGLGAFELAFRYSYLDLDSGLTLVERRSFDSTTGDSASYALVQPGGKMHAFTAGLNWYLNPNLRTTLNYNFTHVSNGYPTIIGTGSFAGPDGRPILNDGDMHSVTLRFQLDF